MYSVVGVALGAVLPKGAESVYGGISLGRPAALALDARVYLSLTDSHG